MSELPTRLRQEPANFLARKLAEGAVRFELYVLGVDGSRSYCDAWAAQLGLSELVDQVEAKSARIAACGPTVAQFQVTAEGPRGPDGRAESLGFETFRVSSQVARTTGAIMGEPANEAGLLAQLMRHNEVNHAASLGTMQAFFARQADENRELREQVRAQESSRLQVYELVEELISGKHRRELEELELAKKIENKAAVVGALTSLLPVAADTVMGKVFPQGAALTSAHLARELLTSLTQSQLMEILPKLNEGQQAQVMRLYKQLAAQEEQAKGGADESSQTQH